MTSSTQNIRDALETALNSLSPALATAWDNVAFPSLAPEVPYQRVNLLFADPDNQEFGANFLDQGYLQVTLYYTPGDGDAPARARGEMIRALFYRGASFTSGGQVTTISKTPTIGQGVVDGDRWAVPVKIRFYSRGIP